MGLRGKRVAIPAEDFDAVVVPGGYAPDRMRLHGPTARFVRDMDKAGKAVAATCFAAIRDDVVNAGAAYADAEVVRDGDLIASRKPEDLPAFRRAVIQAVSEGRARSKKVA